jgi:hypothetical protein
MTRRRICDRNEVVPAICARLSAGEPMTVICRDMGVSVRTVNDWRKADAGIAAQFDEARELGFDAIAHECMSIADDGSRDYTTTTDGREVPDHDHISRAKLRIETRLKLLAKWDPRRYGDALKLSGDPEAPLAGLTDEQLDERLAVLLAKRGEA